MGLPHPGILSCHNIHNIRQSLATQNVKFPSRFWGRTPVPKEPRHKGHLLMRFAECSSTPGPTVTHESHPHCILKQTERIATKKSSAASHYRTPRLSNREGDSNHELAYPIVWITPSCCM